jgi:hypothetical protein
MEGVITSFEVPRSIEGVTETWDTIVLQKVLRCASKLDSSASFSEHTITELTYDDIRLKAKFVRKTVSPSGARSAWQT